MQSASGNQLVKNFFTNGRHLNLSVVFVSQNVFYIRKKCRTISLNSTYIVVFKNPRDQTQIRHLACHIFPSKPKFLQAAYEEETKDPYRYLFLDFHSNSSEFARVLGNIFPYEPLKKTRVVSISQKTCKPKRILQPQPLCIKEPAYITKYSFVFGLNDVKSDMSYHGLCKI